MNNLEQTYKDNSLAKILETCPKNETIMKAWIKAYSILKDRGYTNIMCALSGGSDSDIMLDMVSKIRKDINYVWFDTGMEYSATKEHLDYLEEKYNIEIERVKAIKPIPLSCREYGQPFMSKHVSNMIGRLQKHEFEWEDKSFEELYAKYPNCKSALEWWCDLKPPAQCIKQNKFLKDFLIEHPPNFSVSDKCCDYAKKKLGHNLIKERGYDLSITGVRKAEGG